MAQFIRSKKFTGVLYRHLKNNDKSYYINYKLNDKHHRIQIGKQSEGINEAFSIKKESKS